MSAHTNPAARRRIDFLGCPLDLYTSAELLGEIRQAIDRRDRKCVIHFVNGNKVAQVAPSKTEDVTITMKPEKVKVTVRSVPSGAKLELDGEKLGTTPYTFEHDPSSGHLPKAELSKRGYRKYESTVAVGDTEPEQTFNFELEKR